MTAEYTDRLGVALWPSGSDPFTRDQMNTSHEALEERAATFLSGPIADRPSVGDATVRMFYLALDENTPYGILYYCDLVDDNSGQLVWVAVNNAAAPESLAPGDAQDEGISSAFSRSDHVHEMLPWGQTTDIANISTSKASGAANAYARADHVHQLGANSVTSSAIASGAISSSNQLGSGVVGTTQLASGAVTRTKIEESQRIPSGSIMPFAGSTAPTGWLLCDGSLVDQSAYSALYAVLGNAYNFGTIPVGKFRLPDLRSRIPLGLSTMNNGITGASLDPSDRITISTADQTLGGNDGADSHVLTIPEIASHNHTNGHDHPSASTSNEAGHVHSAPGGGAFATTGVPSPFPAGLGLINGGNAVGFTNLGGAHSHTFDVPAYSGNTGNAGGGSAHNNLQPFLTLAYLIKT